MTDMSQFRTVTDTSQSWEVAKLITGKSVVDASELAEANGFFLDFGGLPIHFNPRRINAYQVDNIIKHAWPG